MKKHSFLTFVLAAFAVLATTLTGAQAETVTVKHSSGTTQIASTPKKIVVFDLASIDTLNRLGVSGIIGVPGGVAYPAYIKAYEDKSYTRAGTLFEPDYETVASLEPDMIIVAGRSQAKYAELAKIAPTIDLTVSTDNYLSDVTRNVTLLGQIFDRQEQAKAEISKLEATLADIKKLTAGKGNGLLILTTGGRMSAFGPGSRFGLLYSGFGIVPADPDLSVGNHGQPVAAEYILKTNPDWLFVIDRDAAIGREGQAASQLLDNVIVNKTKAAQRKHIIYLDPQNWYLVGGSLSGLHETAEQIAAAFK
ncbi:MAG: Periplasmic binding protein [Candidatus Tokpelaia hoelldobleri]|uniref:Periplasmic binding protein n=1 Tax=Candidatus Tokpelaia hoelldobleri TaxID=1902579 RepID=A0A1U9JTB9_9HYPH|nr:MAG: Periplasmic binding protein [Candidatus Tokpelaia hoelldoblerii]